MTIEGKRKEGIYIATELRLILRLLTVISTLLMPIGLIWSNAYIFISGSSFTMIIFALIYKKLTRGICPKLVKLMIINFIFTSSVLLGFDILAIILWLIGYPYCIYTIYKFFKKKKTLNPKS